MNKEIGMRIGKLVTAATLFTGVGAACGGKSAGEAEVSFVPRAETATVLPTETPTLMPTATVEPTKTPTPKPVEKIPTAPEVSEMVKSSVANLTFKDIYDKGLATEVLSSIAEGEAAINTNPGGQQAINAYGGAGKALISLACKYTDNEEVAKAALAIKSLQLSIVKSFEDRGIFEKGSTKFSESHYFSIPRDCQNQFLKPQAK